MSGDQATSPESGLEKERCGMINDESLDIVDITGIITINIYQDILIN